MAGAGAIGRMPRVSEHLPAPYPQALTFGAFADTYEATRPGYPSEAVEWLVPGDSDVVVELGAGTGKLTRALSRSGRRVLAVEPDARMRAVLTGLRLAGVEAVEGSAESIPLADASARAVVSGSAFHWFDLDRTLCETARVLGPGGTLAFAWNRKDVRAAWIRRVVEAMSRSERWMGDRPWAELVGASPLFGPVESAFFPHVVELARAQVADYVCSYATVVSLPDAERAAVVENVEAIVEDEFGPASTIRLPFVVDAYRACATSADSSLPSR